MWERNTIAVVAAAILICGSTVLVATGVASDGFSDWILNFQTLITGILSVAAAAVTILWMRAAMRQERSLSEQKIERDFHATESTFPFVLQELHEFVHDWADTIKSILDSPPVYRKEWLESRIPPSRIDDNDNNQQDYITYLSEQLLKRFDESDEELASILNRLPDETKMRWEAGVQFGKVHPEEFGKGGRLYSFPPGFKIPIVPMHCIQSIKDYINTAKPGQGSVVFDILDEYEKLRKFSWSLAGAYRRNERASGPNVAMLAHTIGRLERLTSGHKVEAPSNPKPISLDEIEETLNWLGIGSLYYTEIAAHMREMRWIEEYVAKKLKSGKALKIEL